MKLFEKKNSVTIKVDADTEELKNKLEEIKKLLLEIQELGIRVKID